MGRFCGVRSTSSCSWTVYGLHAFIDYKFPIQRLLYTFISEKFSFVPKSGAYKYYLRKCIAIQHRLILSSILQIASSSTVAPATIWNSLPPAVRTCRSNGSSSSSQGQLTSSRSFNPLSAFLLRPSYDSELASADHDAHLQITRVHIYLEMANIMVLTLSRCVSESKKPV